MMTVAFACHDLAYSLDLSYLRVPMGTKKVYERITTIEIERNIKKVSSASLDKLFIKFTRNRKCQEVIRELQKRGDSIEFAEDISDFSIRVNRTIYFNAHLFDNKLLLPANRGALKNIILSQLRKHLWTKPQYNSKIEELVSEKASLIAELHTLIVPVMPEFDLYFLGARLAKRRMRFIRKVLKKIGINSSLIINKLNLAEEIIDLKVLRGGMDEEFHYERVGYGKQGLSEMGIAKVLAFHESSGDLEFLLPILRYWITENEGNGLKVVNEAMDQDEDYQSLPQSVRFKELISKIDRGRGDPSYNEALRYLRGKGFSTDTNNQYFAHRMIKVLGFLLETKREDSAIEDFLWDYLRGQEGPVIDTAFEFCAKLLEEAIREKADLYFIYRGAWPLKEITMRLAGARGLRMEDRFHELYFTGEGKIKDNTKKEEQFKYLYDQGIFNSKKVILVDGGFFGTVATHIASLISDKDLVSTVNDKYSINIIPKKGKKVGIWLLVFAGNNEFSNIATAIYSYQTRDGYPIIYFSPRALFYTNRGKKYRDLEKKSFESTNSVYLFDERLEFDYLSPLRLLETGGRFAPVLEETLLPRLRDISKEWLNRLIDASLPDSDNTQDIQRSIKLGQKLDRYI